MHIRNRSANSNLGLRKNSTKEKLSLALTREVVWIFFKIQERQGPGELLDMAKNEVIGFAKYEWGKDAEVSFHSDFVEIETFSGMKEIIKRETKS